MGWGENGRSGAGGSEECRVRGQQWLRKRSRAGVCRAEGQRRMDLCADRNHHRKRVAVSIHLVLSSLLPCHLEFLLVLFEGK